MTRQTVYAITDLTAREASPQRIGHLARSQWLIENRLHFVRDTVFAEDSSTIRTGHGPENMATRRNLAINTLRAAAHLTRCRPLARLVHGVPLPVSCRGASSANPGSHTPVTGTSPYSCRTGGPTDTHRAA